MAHIKHAQAYKDTNDCGIRFHNEQETVKASNAPRDGKEGILMAKKIFEWRQLFSNDNIFLGRYAFIRSDVGRKDVLSK